MYSRIKVCLAAAAIVAMATCTVRASWSDNFDTYDAGSMIIGQGAWVGWEHVNNDDAPVTNAQAYSAPNSLQVGGATAVDLVPEFSGATSGVWNLDVMTYVPADSALQYADIGFLSAHKGFQGETVTQWFGPFTLNMATGLVNGNALVPIVRDQWIPMHTVFDIDAKTYDIYYNGTLAKSGTWSADYYNAVVGLDVWTPGGASTLYYDNFSMAPEPSTLVLLAAGLLCLACYAWRRRRS